MKNKKVIRNLIGEGSCNWGVYFSGSHLRMLQVDFKDEKSQILGWVEKRIPKGIIEQAKIIKKEVFIEIFREAVDDVNGIFCGKNITVTIPEEEVYTSVIEVPLIEDQKALKETLKWETESSMPVSVDDIYYDWQIIEKNENKMKVLVMATNKEIIDNYLEVFDELGFKVLAFEPESLSLARSLIKFDSKDEYTLLVNIGTDFSSFVICNKNIPIFNSSSSISGRMLTEIVVKEMGFSFEKAERYKIKRGTEEAGFLNGQEKNVFLPILEMLVEEIKKTKDFLNESLFLGKSEQKFSKIILCGGGSNLKGLDSYLTVKLKQLVTQSNPWINFSFDKKIPPISKQDSQGFASVIGLILRLKEYEKDN